MSDHSSYDNVQKLENITTALPATSENTEVNTTSIGISNSTAAQVPIQRVATAAAEKELTEGRKNLQKWLGKTFRVVITDGRVLVGFFNCTDKDANVVLSMCAEYLEEGKDARILGNVMIPGKHIVSIAVDMPKDELAGQKLEKLAEMQSAQEAQL